MVVAFIIAVWAVPALVFLEPRFDADGYDFYVQHMADGWLKTFLSYRGRNLYDASQFAVNFFISAMVLLTIHAMATAPWGAFSEALSALQFLIVLFRYGHAKILRCYQWYGGLSLLAIILLCLLSVLNVFFGFAIGVAMVASPVVGLGASFSAMPVIACLLAQMVWTGIVANTVRTKQYLYGASPNYASQPVEVINLSETPSPLDISAV